MSAIINTPKTAPAKEVVKDASMVKQKEMMASHYDRLTNAPQTGEKVASTFVPGNLNELIMCFGLVNNLPEVNAIQNGLRRTSGAYVLEAEKIGHSEDVCTYVKSDIGMMAKGNLAPNGKKFPNPDVLLLSYTGCFTFMKWFELLREQYKCETIMLHTPYMGDGKITPNMIEYMVKQLKEEVIPKLERISGVKFDIDRLREYLKKSVKAEEELVWVLQSAKHKPSPIDAYFGGIYYIGPIFGAFRGTDDAIEYYKFLREEVADRLAHGQGPVTPDGDMGQEKYRLGSLCLDEQHLASVRTWQDAVRVHAKEHHGIPAEFAGREDSILTWMRQHEIESPWRIAPELAEAGVTERLAIR